MQAFHGDPSVVGQDVRLNGVAFTVIGVAPASFTGLELVLPGGTLFALLLFLYRRGSLLDQR